MKHSVQLQSLAEGEVVKDSTRARRLTDLYPDKKHLLMKPVSHSDTERESTYLALRPPASHPPTTSFPQEMTRGFLYHVCVKNTRVEQC